MQEYKRQGGGYKGRKSKDNSLERWTEEEWGTRSGRKSTETSERYLPKKAREGLSGKEYARTTAKKRADTKKGKQFSKQPRDFAKRPPAFAATAHPARAACAPSSMLRPSGGISRAARG